MKGSIEKRFKKIESQNGLIENQLKEINWANIFNSAITGSTWFNNIPLNVGRWAANYSLFYVLYRILNEINPQNVLELGLGETTKMIQAYKQYQNNEAFCITIEQDNDWIEMRLNNGISNDYINVLKTELKKIKVKDFDTLVYDDLTNKLKNLNKKFNLILIDGPWGSPNYSRYDVVGILETGLIADDFIIIMDDYNRRGEQETINELMDKLTEHNYNFITGKYVGDKSQIVIASSRFKYLESL